MLRDRAVVVIKLLDSRLFYENKYLVQLWYKMTEHIICMLVGPKC